MKLLYLLLFTIIALCSAKEPDLPICPSNIQFLPQNLPMHCRMPINLNYPAFPPAPNQPLNVAFSPQYIQNPTNKQPSMAIPLPPGIPGPMLLPPGTQGPVAMPPGPVPIFPAPPNKLPVVVMPFYSPNSSKKKLNRKPRKSKKKIYDIFSDSQSDTSDTSSDTSNSSDEGWWYKNKRRSNNRRRNKHKRKHTKQKKELLTPILQYVTKDGYVIYEKRISRGEAKDWLNEQNEITKDNKQNNEQDITDDTYDSDIKTATEKDNLNLKYDGYRVQTHKNYVGKKHYQNLRMLKKKKN